MRKGLLRSFHPARWSTSAISLVAAFAAAGHVAAADGVSGERPPAGPGALATPAASEPRNADQDSELLQSYGLIVPVRDVSRKSLRDTFDERRGGARHEAL